MAMPKSVTKIKKGGVEFISNVDKAQYSVQELSRAALRDSAKLLRRRTIEKIKTLPGLRRSRLPYKVVGYWVRKRENDLQIGFGNTKKGGSGDYWFAIRQEIGSSGKVGKGGRATMPKKGFLRETVFENIDEIRKIQGQYLSAIEDDNRARGLIDEKEQMSGDGSE